MDKHLFTVVLSGGSGTRLWPISRSSYPKQFADFKRTETLFESTIRRVSSLNDYRESIVVCNKSNIYFVNNSLDRLNQKALLILEPEARSTAPAIALAAFAALQRDPDAILFVLPSDGMIQGEKTFQKAVANAVELAKKNFLVTFGIGPRSPETGFGYIEAGNSIENLGNIVSRFVEKPDVVHAKQMLETGGFYWNSGMFVFNAKTFLSELKDKNTEIYDTCEKAFNRGILFDNNFNPDPNEYRKCPEDSVDYAVMEHTSKAAVVPLNVLWNDLGTWSSFYEVGEKDSFQNVKNGDVICQDTSNCFIHSSGRLIATIGIKGLAVVETRDALLVSALDQAQKVKSLVQILKSQDRKEADLPSVVNRPWGTYESLASGPHFQVKRLIVHPGQSLSLQYHNHRAEHWTVVEGIAQITIDESTKEYSKNKSVYIPIRSKHRLTNNSTSNVVVIEVQSGDYLGEDDIVRIDDVYHRI